MTTAPPSPAPPPASTTAEERERLLEVSGLPLAYWDIPFIAKGVHVLLSERDRLEAEVTRLREALSAAGQALLSINMNPSVGLGVATMAANAKFAVDAALAPLDATTMEGSK